MRWSPLAKCSLCGEKAIIKIPYARINLCEKHFIKYYEKRIKKTVEKYGLIRKGDKILVALSGGKDSISVLSALKVISGDMGFTVIPAHINLGLWEFSTESEEVVREAAGKLGLEPIIVRLRDALGVGIPELAVKSRRPPCSVCGMVKRYFINLLAVKIGASSVALGHHMDDLAAYALKSILTSDYGMLKKLGPKTESEEEIVVGRIRPLYLTTERENLVYALVKKLPFTKNKCPNALPKSFESELKAFMNRLDVRHPGVRISFMKGVVKELMPRIPAPEGSFVPCRHCGMASMEGVCGFCRLTERVLGVPGGIKAVEYVDHLIKKYGY